MLGPKVFKARNLAKSEEKNVTDKNVYLDYCPDQTIFCTIMHFIKTNFFLIKSYAAQTPLGKFDDK